jgi:cobalamin biosynthesis Mg chelatase CobN
MRTLKTLCCAAALAALLTPGARADEWNKKTFLTFSGPVQLPGVTLPAGTYTFELANPDSTRHVIRVSSQDGTKVMAMFITIPSEMVDPPSENVVMFSERAAGTPQAIQSWFYPGDRIGEEFVYPRRQAIEIAKATHKPVLATEENTNANATEAERMTAMKGASVGRVDESGRMSANARSATTTTATTTTADNQPRQMPSATTGDEGQANRAQVPPTAAERPRTTTADRAVGTSGTSQAQPAPAAPRTTTAQRQAQGQLPKTASSLTVFELLSGLSLGAAFALRQVRRRYAAAE